MKRKYFFALICAILTLVTSTPRRIEKQASEYVDYVCDEITKRNYEANVKAFDYESNINDENRILKEEAEEELAKFQKEVALDLLQYNFKRFENETLKRMIQKFTKIDDDVLDPIDYRELHSTTTRMHENFAKVKIPSYKDKSKLLQLEPEITEIFESSSDPEELKYYWTEWYDRAGTPVKDDFFKYAKLKNKAAVLNGFPNTAEHWLDMYEDPTFEQQIVNILEQLRPLYLQLHGYVRHKLYKFYGPDHVDLKKPIPMHLLGNMWGQKFELIDKVKPFKKVRKIDTTHELLEQKYTPKKFFESAEEFFVSINMTKMPESFWKYSIIEKPNDGREMFCHASAHACSCMMLYGDVRIRQCTRISLESFITVHHEMGHIEYYLQYQNQPNPFRRGANPGFHEAIGDSITLSVSTPKHLHRIGLLAEETNDPKSIINLQLELGMQKLAFLPFAYTMDKIRYDVFRGNIQPENANCHFGVFEKTKYHISADVEYMRYFVSNIIQFQFHKAACIKAGEYEPNNPAKTLYNCDIYNSTDAGNALKEMLALGASKPWPDALEVLTGERTINADAILEYFAPLVTWLKASNKKLGVNIGWTHSDEIDCPL